MAKHLSKLLIACMIIALSVLTGCSPGKVEGAKTGNTKPSAAVPPTSVKTNELHEDIVQNEQDSLIKEAGETVLQSFKGNSEVRKAIVDYGGDPADAYYYVSETEDDKPDVMSLQNGDFLVFMLHADFPTSDGRKRVRCLIQRQVDKDGKPFGPNLWHPVIEVGYVTGSNGTDTIEAIEMKELK